MMQRGLVLVMAAVTVSVGSATYADESLKEHPLVKSNINLLETWVEPQLAYQGIPGMSIAIAQDQDILYLGGFGEANFAGEGLVLGCIDSEAE